MAAKIAFCGIFSALALALGYLERLIPMPGVVPGVKLGLANAAVLVIMYRVGSKQAFAVSTVKILLTGLLLSGPSGFAYSAAGGALSFLTMLLLRKTHLFSVMGVSVAGGVSHNIGQIVLAAFVVSDYRLLYYIPVLTLSGIAAGIVTGLIATYTIYYISGSRYSNR